MTSPHFSYQIIRFKPSINFNKRWHHLTFHIRLQDLNHPCDACNLTSKIKQIFGQLSSFNVVNVRCLNNKISNCKFNQPVWGANGGCENPEGTVLELESEWAPVRGEGTSAESECRSCFLEGLDKRKEFEEGRPTTRSEPWFGGGIGARAGEGTPCGEKKFFWLKSTMVKLARLDLSGCHPCKGETSGAISVTSDV